MVNENTSHSSKIILADGRVDTDEHNARALWYHKLIFLYKMTLKTCIKEQVPGNGWFKSLISEWTCTFCLEYVHWCLPKFVRNFGK